MMTDNSSKRVETTLGPLSAAELGKIDIHDHVFIDHGRAPFLNSDFRLDSVEAACRDILDWKHAGGGALLDAIPPGAGRNAAKCIEVSQQTGIPVILSSGFHKDHYYFPDHWRYCLDEEAMVDLILAECIEGVDKHSYRFPHVERLSVKAGALKVAGEYHRIEDTMKTGIRVVGRVHQQTGVPVFVHTEATPPFDLIDLLEQSGVPASSILICHLDRNPDIHLHKRVANRGVFLEYDTPGRVKLQPESVCVDLIKELIAEGYGDRLTLGGDLARRSYLPGYGGGPGYQYLLNVFNLRLTEAGISESDIEAIWHDNPVRWLTNALPAPETAQ